MSEETTGIELGDLFSTEQTSEVEESEVLEESEEILDEEITDDEIMEDDSQEVEESEEVDEENGDIRDLKSIEIKFQDDEVKQLGDFTDEEIIRYHQLGRKSEFKLEEASKETAKAQETVRDISNIAEMYGLDVEKLLGQLEDQIFSTRSQEPGGKDEGRHIDDIRSEYREANKSSKERSINNLLESYPELTAESIPEDVLNGLKYGKDITDLYEKHVIETKNKDLQNKLDKLEKEMKVISQNKKSKSKAFIKGKSGAAKNTGSSLLSEINNILGGN